LERLRHIREQAGYSQQDLADESGVSQHTISEIELGRRKPQGRTLRKLAGVLGVEVRDFFEEAARPKVLRPRSLAELLERAGLKTRWLTLPREEFETWWRDVDYEEAKQRFWQIHEEYLTFKAAAEAIARGESRVAPELERQMGVLAQEAWPKHFYALAAAPSVKESEADFHERQQQGELRPFVSGEREKPAEELIAPAV